MHVIKGAVDLVYLNEFQLVSSMFSLKAAAPQTASAWVEGIQRTQVRSSDCFFFIRFK